GVRVVALCVTGAAAGRGAGLEAVVRAAACAVRRVGVGTLGVCIPAVGAHYLMVRQARGRDAAAGVRVVALCVTGAAAGCGRCLEAIVRAAACPITLVLVGTLGVCIPTVGAHYLMVRQARGRDAAAGVRVVALCVTGAAAGRGAGLEAVVRTAAGVVTLLLVTTV